MLRSVELLPVNLMIYFRKEGDVLLGRGRDYDGIDRRIGLLRAPYPTSNISAAIVDTCYERIGLEPTAFNLAAEWDTKDLDGQFRRTVIYSVSQFEGRLREADGFVDPRWYSVAYNAQENRLPTDELGHEQSQIIPRLIPAKPSRFVFDRSGGTQNPVLTSFLALNGV